jgi:hypothetical protein
MTLETVMFPENGTIKGRVFYENYFQSLVS